MNRPLFFRYLAIISLCLIPVIKATAQETTPEAWEITQRCLGDLPYPTIPQNQWDFEGVIFSKNNEGIRAIRADVETSYFVALDAADSFASVGAFSPDGRWFAYPVGDSSFGVNMVGDQGFHIQGLQIVSTDPQRTVHTIPWEDSTMGSAAEYALRHVQWVDNERFIYEGRAEGGGGIINAVTDELEPWENIIPLFTLSLFSPDFSHAFYWRSADGLHLYDTEDDALIQQFPDYWYPFIWLPDSSGFIARNNAELALTLYNRSGEILQVIASIGGYDSVAVSPNGTMLAFTARNQLYIADMQNKAVYDLCFEMKGQGIAWSPDSTSIAFTYDTYPILLNVETLAMQILRYQTTEIIGWYPTE